MKGPWPALLLVAAWAICTSPKAHAHKLSFLQLRASTACSCDCCEVVELLPTEQRVLGNGVQLTHQCGAKTGELCSATCQTSEGAESDTGEVCAELCRPSTPTAGTVCTALTKAEQEALESGNPDASVASQLPANGNEPSWETELKAKAAAREADLEQAKLAGASPEELEMMKQTIRTGVSIPSLPSTQESVTYDLRGVVAQRMRAEAAGALASSAVSASRTRLNRHLADRRATQSKLAAKTAELSVPQLESGGAAPQGNATAAQNEAMRAQAAVQQARQLAGPALLADAKSMAIAGIREAAAADAKREADAYAELAGWEKPPGWAAVVGQKAADPYMKLAGVAAQRVADYHATASSSLSGANTAIATAETSVARARALQRAGKAKEAAAEWALAAKALGQSKQLQGEFEQSVSVAFNASDISAQWRGAGERAAAAASWRYMNTYTLPPA